MGLLKDYKNYIQDNPQHYWFKRKIWGWGWTPVTWEGSLTLLVFIALVVGNAVRVDSASHSASDTLYGVVPQTVGLVLLLIVICYWKGEPPKWQWGFPKKEDHKSDSA